MFNPKYILPFQDEIYCVRVPLKPNPNFGVLLRLNGQTHIQPSKKDDYYNLCGESFDVTLKTEYSFCKAFFRKRVSGARPSYW